MGKQASGVTNVFDLSKSLSNISANDISDLKEEDLKFTGGILDDYLYETNLLEPEVVSQNRF